jgi:endonuclease/exonuclease/phosphatase (EEP) superfamily protein YafD
MKEVVSDTISLIQNKRQIAGHHDALIMCTFWNSANQPAEQIRHLLSTPKEMMLIVITAKDRQTILVITVKELGHIDL